MERSRWCIPDFRNGTNCTTTTVYYPTRILHDQDLATETAKVTADSNIVLYPPKAFIISSLSATLNEADGNGYVPVKSALSIANSEPSSGAANTGPPIEPPSSDRQTTLSSSPTPTIATTSLPLPSSAAVSTMTIAPVESSGVPSAIAPTRVGGNSYNGPNRWTIAGGVIAAVAVALIAFAVFICHRRKHHRSAGGSSNPTWEQIEEAEKAEVSAPDRNPKNRAGDSADNKQLDTCQTTLSRFDSSKTLGEPGPSFELGSDQQLITALYLDTSQEYKDTISNTSSVSDASNPVLTAIESSGDTDSDFGSYNPTRSQIGLALTRCSTNTLKHIPSPSHHDIATQLPQSPHVTPLTEPLRMEAVAQDAKASRAASHKRASSISAITDDQDCAVIQVAELRDVRDRRHSALRLIDIIPSSSRSDGGDGVSRSNSYSELSGADRRGHGRARSASPARTLEKYTGSPAKLNGHFGIETWGMQPGRTSSEHGVNGGQDELPQATSHTDIDRQWSTKSGATYSREIKTTEHRRCPPTSYPNMDRSLSRTKKRLREQSKEISRLVVELPDSVTIERGHRRV